jgi:hypothetical protein
VSGLERAAFGAARHGLVTLRCPIVPHFTRMDAHATGRSQELARFCTRLLLTVGHRPAKWERSNAGSHPAGLVVWTLTPILV